MAAGDARLQGGPAVRDDAEALRRHATALADADAEAYGRVLTAERAAPDGDALGPEVRSALGVATQVPLELVDVARRVAVLAAPLCTTGNPRLRGEALTAVALAEAAATAAAHLVRANVRRGRLDDDPVRCADAWCAQARDVARRAGCWP